MYRCRSAASELAHRVPAESVLTRVCLQPAPSAGFPTIRALLLLSLLLLTTSIASQQPVNVYVFASVDCPHCEAQKPFLQQLAADHEQIELQVFEVLRTVHHRDPFRRMAEAHGITAGSVPTIFVGGRAWIGDGPSIRREIAAWVEHCLSSGDCPDSARGHIPLQASGDERRSPTIDLPLTGAVDLGAAPLLFSTVLIALIDGFNPCSLWVLTILLALVIHSGSRVRVLVVGLTFLSVTALIYGLFISGMFGVLSYLLYLDWVYWLVAGFALLFALVNIKDYFWYKRGLSFTIDDRHKPGLFRSMRGLLKEGRSMPALIMATVVMAAGVALIELPCTAGFPVVWSSLVAAQEVDWPYFVVLLATYLLVYLSIELVIFVTALVTFRIDRFEERHGRILKLFGGMIMLALAVVLLIEPALMRDAGSTFAVFLGALCAAFALMVIQRRILPLMGVRLGDDWEDRP